ncbi:MULTISPECIES: hypothetical protein [unclassified Streptomyces]|uniref:hypothetical protein n=1 Tax=unclassified Streptomyces TaxID=2593676 RepID=UPI00340E7D93
MAGRRGAQQRGRSDVFRPDQSVSPRLRLSPGEPERTMYEELLADMDVSGAEVLREGLRALYAQRYGSTSLKEAS